VKEIVIVGAGYAGISAARKLGKTFKNDADVKITLVDKHAYHTYMTELHEVAGGRVEANAVKYDLQRIFNKYKKVQLVTDTVVGIDEATKTVQGESYSYHYDYLILAMGGEANDFGVAGVKENGFTLWSLAAAERIRAASGIMQSTSPNEVLLASLDAARAQMAEEGRGRLASAIRLAEELRRRINEIPGLWSFGEEYMGAPGMAALDPLKITVQVMGLGMTGFAAEAELRWRNIACELADARNVLFLLSYADGERETELLCAALRDMAASCAPECISRGAGSAAFLELPPLPETVLSPRDAYFADSVSAAAEDAEGRIAAETIMFYPPGIPVLVPGDRVDRKTLAYLRAMRAVGARVVGAADASLRTIRVIAEG